MRWVLLASVIAVSLLPFPQPAGLSGGYAPAGLAWAADAETVDLAEVVRLLAEEADGAAQVDPVTLLAGALDTAAEQIAPLTYQLEGEPERPQLTVRVGTAEHSLSLTRRASLDATGRVLLRVREFIRKALPRAPRPDSLNALLADGFVRALDPHGALLSATAYGDFQSRASGRMDGQGILFGRSDGQLVVDSVLAGSPADRAGVRAGDRVLRIGAETAVNMALEDALNRVRGPVGTTVRLLVEPTGVREPRERALKRGRLRLTSLEGRVIRSNGRERIGYLRLHSFQERTSAELREALNRFRQTSPGLLGLVLDLRDNHGGVLEQAIRVADQFLERGTIVSLSGPRMPEESVPARWYRSVTSAPLVVLVNGDTASSAEVLAGALKRNRRAVLIGTPTFGKHSIQSLFPLAGGHALKITVAHYRTGDEGRADGGRVIPHVQLEPVRFPAGNAGPRGLPATVLTAPMPEDDTPLRRLPYLVAADAASAERLGGVAPGEDYALRVAVRLLRENAPQGPTALLRTALDWALNERRQQDRAIAEQLVERRVDWSAGSGTQGGPASIGAVELESRGSPGGLWAPVTAGHAVPPGAALRLTVTVHNHGRMPLHRLLVLGGADVPWLNGLELPLGRLDAGRSTRAFVELVPPSEQPAGVEMLRLRLMNGRGLALDTRQVPVTVAAPPRARLELSVRALDDGRAGSQGNGDGRLQPGERITLRIGIRNEGEGVAHAGRVWLSGVDARRVQASRTWAVLPDLAPGASAVVDLPVRIAESAGYRELPLELSVTDARMGPEPHRHPLALTAGQALPRLTLRPPRIQSAALPSIVTGRELQLAGRIVDDERVRDVRIYRNGRKVLYFAGGSEALTYHQRLPLEPGRNLLRIVARDDAGLTTVHTAVVWRDAGAAQTADAAPGWPAAWRRLLAGHTDRVDP